MSGALVALGLDIKGFITTLEVISGAVDSRMELRATPSSPGWWC